MKDFGYQTYLSPFTWRYGSDQMRQIFSEENKFKTWRKIWVALAKAQAKQGLVSKKEVLDLEKNQNKIDIERILEIEKETKHDVIAAIKEFAEKAKTGGGKIHLGATSMDINDNADSLRSQEALNVIEEELKKLLEAFSKKIKVYKDFPCMGYTHLQSAEPTTIGYRLAFNAQDLLLDLELLQFVKKNLKGKGIKGAVGTSASYVKLLDLKRAKVMEEEVMNDLGMEPFLITNQTSPRKVELFLGDLLSSIAQSLYKFAYDVRIMQSAGFGEWQEPFSKSQVGSSAMPFKKNPIKSEQICSLARVVVNLSRTLWENASLTLLERTLDDSANRRVVIPEIFLAVDEMLNSAIKIVDGLIINERKVKENLNKFWPFSATETVLIEAVKSGANRQEMHEILRDLSMKAWEEVQNSGSNPLTEMITSDKRISKFIRKDQLDNLFDPRSHLGLAPKKCDQLIKKIGKS